ncbi:MAG: glutamine synthetase [Candidatus Heimdallarchaeota archaeon]|nr:glutamine synthetase [Candidatus Heimdallarchaeota archaeon]
MEQDIEKALTDIDYVQFQFTSIAGQLKAVEVPKKFAKEYLEEGLGIDGSSVGFLSTEQSDMRIKPDLTTFHLIPWDNRIARVICDIHDTKDQPIQSDPRSILKRAIAMAKIDFGFEMRARPELEWYVMNPDGEPVDIGGYMDAPPFDSEIELRRMMSNYMMDFDIYPKMIHHEVGPGQMEIEFTMIQPLLAADMIQTVKQIVRMVSWNSGLISSFIPKPYTTEAGNGLHIHHMLYKGKENLFSATDGTPSETLKYFVGGLLKHAPGMTAIFNPIVNSYKRLVSGHEAPVYVSWGIGNRTALVRVPGYEKSARIEYRGADTAANIYLVLALLLASGLDGIRNKINPIEGTKLNVDKLSDEKRKEMGIIKTPSNLKEALEALNGDKFLCDFLGSQFIEIYNETKKNEWDAYVKNVKNPNTHEVTEWEFNQMFERI